MNIIRDYYVDPTGQDERIAIRARDKDSGQSIACGLVRADTLIRALARRGRVWSQRAARGEPNAQT